MVKIDTLKLRRSVGREEFDHLTLSSVLSSYAGVRQKINELLKAGTILRVKKGLYVFEPSLQQKPICKETIANLIYGPSCISLEYALSYHGLIPERVETITSVTPKKNKEFNTPIGRFTYRHLAEKKYPHAIEQQWVDKEHPILIAGPEKALCDYITVNSVPDLKMAKDAKDFLIFDLRIEQENWKRFDVRKLLRLNKHYKSRSVETILEVL